MHLKSDNEGVAFGKSVLIRGGQFSNIILHVSQCVWNLSWIQGCPVVGVSL